MSAPMIEALGALVALAVGAPSERAPTRNICLVALDAVVGAEVDVLMDALAIEARKRALDIAVGPPAELGACDVTVTLAARTEVATRTSLRVLALGGLEPLDRAPEIARAVGAALEVEPTPGELFGGDLPTFTPEPLVVAPAPIEPVPMAPPASSERSIRVSLGGAVVAPTDAPAAAGHLDASVALTLIEPWLFTRIGVHTTTPATVRDGRGTLQRVELGGHATLGLVGSPGVWRVSGELGLGLAARWSSATADEVGGLPGVSARHTEVVSSAVARIGVAWEVTRSFWFGVDGLAQRYLAGTSFVALATRLEAPRWTVGGGLRLGIRL